MTALHHGAIYARDLETSLHFYRDGIGLEMLMDQGFDGDWRTLFDARSNRLRSIFLGDPDRPEVGIVELVAFETAPPDPPRSPGPLTPGFFLLSFFVDVDQTLARIEQLGLAKDLRRIHVESPRGAVPMATLRDPDGVLVELVGAPL